VISVTLYSRSGCHLCELAIEELDKLRAERDFEFEVILIDGDLELEKLYGEQIPVTLINGKAHDFWRVDPERFRAAISQL
jgi:glutaredoxin